MSSGFLAAASAVGLTTLDSNDEARRLFTKARQCESDGDFVAAQEFYEEVVQVEPDFIYAWANLANVLVQRGNLEQGLLCYKKALSLRPPAGEQLSTILLNTATTEASLGNNVAAVRDMELAEKVSGPTTNIVTNKAVLLTQQNKWQEGCDTFERVFKTSEKDALPWWLRYSMALLETNRALEAVAYMQRVLQRYPYEAECKAFATALYEALGSRQEAARYWEQMSDTEKVMYTDPVFLSDKLKWGPVATKSLLRYTSTNQGR
jgi:tetratricopeptide (TPR) repeat protein